MTEKTHIVSTLGEQKLLLPTLVNDALAANDRAKYFFTLLQTARGAANRPHETVPDLRRERLASGVGDETLDGFAAAARLLEGGRYRIPGVARVLEDLAQAVDAMLVPLRADGEAHEKLLARHATLEAALAAPAVEDVIDGALIDRLTSGERTKGDSLHLLVMDAHKALNRLQGELATESVAGASCYGIEAGDRALVAAFMRGVARTAPLKFDHPGLATTATRSGDRLVIQNDIGTTDAHVLVVHVDAEAVAVTYTDVHLQRLLFFQSLFDGRGVEWDDTRSRKDAALEDGVYHLSVGRHAAATAQAREAFLTFLGSRLVFLIDWNRARKRIRNFLPRAETLSVLKWAADHDLGHMAFLKAGGEHLVYEALASAGKGQFRIGDQLHAVLGRRAAADYMRFVLKTAAEALLRGDSEQYVQDTVRAELFNHFRTTRQNLFDVVGEHAAYIVELAFGVRDALVAARLGEAARIAGAARRAKDWESRADALVNQVRASVRQAEAGEFFRDLAEAADDIADELEDAAFHLTLIPPGPAAGTLHAALREIGDLVVQGAQEYMKSLETARHVRRGGPPEDTQEFLEAIHRISLIERRADEAQRRVEIAVAQTEGDFRTLYAVTETARNLEQASDALMHCGLHLRDFILAQVMQV